MARALLGMTAWVPYHSALPPTAPWEGAGHRPSPAVRPGCSCCGVEHPVTSWGLENRGYSSARSWVAGQGHTEYEVATQTRHVALAICFCPLGGVPWVDRTIPWGLCMAQQADRSSHSANPVCLAFCFQNWCGESAVMLVTAPAFAPEPYVVVPPASALCRVPTAHWAAAAAHSQVGRPRHRELEVPDQGLAPGIVIQIQALKHPR